MDPLNKLKQIQATYPALVKFWTSRHDHDLFFLNRLEFEKFSKKYCKLFKDGFLDSLEINEDEITTVSMVVWTSGLSG